jgi:hypothetical protein
MRLQDSFDPHTFLCLMILVLWSLLSPVRLLAQSLVGGDVGPAFTESSAPVFAGALEMATVEPSSGVFRSSLPIDVPAARGGAQPGLGLTYSSAAGIREAGMGWGLNLPVIERRGPFGGPPDYYSDPSVEADLSSFVHPNDREGYIKTRRTQLARMGYVRDTCKNRSQEYC